MVAFPPLQSSTTSVCNSPEGLSSNYTAYDSTNRRYLDDQISSDYKAAGSGLQLHTAPGDSACIRSNGYTSYTEALRQAQAEVQAHGRVNVPNYIIFLTDGEANIGSVYGFGDAKYPPGNADDQQPCASAVNVADGIKRGGTTIYAIGYALNDKACTAGKWEEIPAVPAVKNQFGTIITPAKPARPCNKAVDGTCDHTAKVKAEVPAITSEDALSAIATSGKFYNKNDPGSLTAIFGAIATDISQGSSRLVDDGF
jgi:hypothetical protein